MSSMRLVPILAALLLAACATSERIQNVIDAPVTKSLSMGEVRTAIERAGKSLGWQLQAERPGFFTGRLALRTHVAEVEIEHDSKSYSIRYRGSSNLDAEDGEINRAYNQWIEKLDRAIRSELETP